MVFEEKIIMGVLHHRGAQLNNIGEAWIKYEPWELTAKLAFAEKSLRVVHREGDKMNAIQRFVQQRHDANLDAAYAAERKERLNKTYHPQSKINALRLRLFRAKCAKIMRNDFSDVKDYFSANNSHISGTIVVSAKARRILL